MSTIPEKRFNLVEEAWIPVSGVGLVSLRRIYSDPTLRALGGNPIQKIALTKLLLAISQSAYTPQNDEDWKSIGAKGVAERSLQYLIEKKDLFWLYGDKPFLQMLAIGKAEKQCYGAVCPDIATGNTTVLLESQIEHLLSDAEKALLLVLLMGFALGGKKTDNSIVLTTGYAGKSNDKGKPSTGKPGPSMGFLGYLHSFVSGMFVQESIWLNLLTQDQLSELKQFSLGMGTPPWEQMPAGEDCPVAKKLKNSLMGRLVPLSRFVLLADDGFYYSEGIMYPSYKEFGFDLSIAVDFSTKPKTIWVDPERRPWRQLTSLLSFLSTDTNKKGCCCKQLDIGVSRARKAIPAFGIWSGGLKVSSNAGEQYASGMDDFVESEVLLCSEYIGENWFVQLKTEMTFLEDSSKILYGATMGYFKHLQADGKDPAGLATNLFWQLCEHAFQNLINACGNDAQNRTDNETKVLRNRFAGFIYKAYDTYCSKETARQLDAWAANRPNLSKYLSKK